MTPIVPTEPGNEAAARKWLSEPLPADPMPALEEWMGEVIARALQPNPNAMTVATVDRDGRPSARIVLCKGYDLKSGYVEFFTNTLSRKGRALAANPRAAVLFHWDALDRQIRIEGPVTRAPDARADEYYAGRHPLSRLGAWASEQSAPIESREALDAKVRDVAARFGVDLATLKNDPKETTLDAPRPPHWGGYRVWAERVELWIGRAGRIHDRAVWERALSASGVGERAFKSGPWSVRRLQP